MAKYRKITPAKAKSMMDKGAAIVLDVRTDSEFNDGHISGAILLPYVEIGSRAEEFLKNKDDTVLVYCRSGRRSLVASKELVKMGYTKVYDFGGIMSWPYETVKL